MIAQFTEQLDRIRKKSGAWGLLHGLSDGTMDVMDSLAVSEPIPGRDPEERVITWTSIGELGRDHVQVWSNVVYDAKRRELTGFDVDGRRPLKIVGAEKTLYPADEAWLAQERLMHEIQAQTEYRMSLIWLRERR